MRDRLTSEPTTDVIQGTLDLLIGIARRVEPIARDVLTVSAET